MNIAWICDNNLKTRPAGGAEITDSYMIEKGISLGNNITIITPDTFALHAIDSFDLHIISNNYTFTKEQRDSMLNNKYILYVHDCLGWKRVVNYTKGILENSLLNIFLSPLHMNQFNNKSSSGICIPPHIHRRAFNQELTRKNNSVVYIGNLWDGVKGANLIYRYAREHNDKVFDFYFYEGVFFAHPIKFF